MLSGANVLVLDQPTNHLDLESITSLNEGLIKFPGAILLASHDYEVLNTVANRIIEITPGGVVDRLDTQYEEYVNNEGIQQRLEELYKDA